MKGLIIKDTKILLAQKKLLILYMFVSLMISFTMDSSFIACYFPMIGVMLILSTIAYDHHDNGLSFLMTMPVKPADYAVAKYVFSLLGLCVSFVVAVILQFVSLFIQHRDFSVIERSPVFCCTDHSITECNSLHRKYPGSNSGLRKNSVLAVNRFCTAYGRSFHPRNA